MRSAARTRTTQRRTLAGIGLGALFALAGVLAASCDGEPFIDGSEQLRYDSEGCLNCHGTKKAEDSTESIRKDIVDTHYDDQKLDEEGNLVVEESLQLEGYLLSAPIEIPEGLGYLTKTSSLACYQSCHNYHDSDMVIAREWARSGHADAKAEAFEYGEFPTGECLRCHNGIAFATVVDQSNSAFPGWTPPESERRAARVMCNACHDGKGYPSKRNKRLRRSGEISLRSGSGRPIIVASDVPPRPRGSTATEDATVRVGNNLACYVCHQGRESGGSVYKLMKIHRVDPYDGVNETFDFLPTAVGVGDFRAADPHYRPAAAMLYGVKGFEIPGKEYSAGVTHHQGDNCIGCHMVQIEGNIDAGGHTMTPTVAMCRECHGPVEAIDAIGPLLDVDGDGRARYPREELDGLKKRLAEELASQGAYFNEHAFPYFFKVSGAPGGPPQIPPNALTRWTEAQLIAGFNLAFVTKDPGAFAHNFRYATQLLRDSYELLTTTTSTTGTSTPTPPLEGIRPRAVNDRPAADYSKR